MTQHHYQDHENKIISLINKCTYINITAHQNTKMYANKINFGHASQIYHIHMQKITKHHSEMYLHFQFIYFFLNYFHMHLK